jgi:tyrosine-protein kinase Etk/Wzc
VLRQTVDLDTKRLELEQARQQALQRFTPQHPSVVALDEQLQLLTKQQGKMQGEIGKLPKTQQEILSLTNDLKVSTQLYTDMLDTIQQLQVTEAGTIGNVRVIDRPLRPLLPSKPKRALLLAAVVIMALILSCGIVLMRHLLRHGVEDPIEVEREFGLATYATIPFATEQRQLWRRDGGRVQPLLAVRSPSVPAVEALRSLRTSLHFAMLEAPNNIVMLTGPSPGLGKTFVSANLGVVLASAGKTVLTIDADLRRGRLHEYFGLVSHPGLSDYIANNIDFENVAQKTEIEGLSVVSRGSSPPNPAELLLNERFTTFLAQAAKKFDYVLIDTPPVLAVTDAALIGRQAGTCFVVLKAGAHPLREIAEVLRRLQRSGVNVKGAVFNQAGGVGTYYGASRYAYSYHAYKD